MTLVVVQKKGSIISAVSDTGITGPGGVPLGLEKHIPKLCILTPNLAVGFAGSPESALDAIAKFDTKLISLKQIVDHFLEFNRKHDVHFILMIRKPILRIVKIAHGREYSSELHTAWIGDQDAYEEFQAYRAMNEEEKRAISGPGVPTMYTDKASEKAHNSVTFNLIGTMLYIIANEKLPSVFGYAVGLSNADGPFAYRPYAYATPITPSNVMQKAAPELLEELREYSMSCYVTNASSPRQGVAFHYMRGKLTYTYFGDSGAPLASCKVVQPMNIEEFMTMMQAEGFAQWSGLVFSQKPPSQNYGIDPNRWRRMEG